VAHDTVLRQVRRCGAAQRQTLTSPTATPSGPSRAVDISVRVVANTAALPAMFSKYTMLFPLRVVTMRSTSPSLSTGTHATQRGRHTTRLTLGRTATAQPHLSTSAAVSVVAEARSIVMTLAVVDRRVVGAAVFSNHDTVLHHHKVHLRHEQAHRTYHSKNARTPTCTSRQQDRCRRPDQLRSKHRSKQPSAIRD
jgi:hypothetical protein